MAARVSVFYAAWFLVVGVHVPYMPVWLERRGLSAPQIGVLLAMALVVRVAAGPLIASAADRRGERRRPILVLALASALTFSLYPAAQSYVALLLVTAILGILVPTIMPLIDTLSVGVARTHGLDYGRLRLWGSISFILATLVGGWLLAGAGAGFVIWWLVAASGGAFLAGLLLPEHASHSTRRGSLLGPLRVLLAQPLFMLFAASAAVVQASHAMFYGFGVLNWQRLGYSGGTAGVLWASGVVAEIALFAFSRRLVMNWGPQWLLVLGAGGGVARWAVLALSPPLPLVFLAQMGHALSYGATHLAAVHFIARGLPTSVAATGQTLYSTMAMGIGLGFTMAISGALYGSTGAAAYWLMAALCAAGLAGAAIATRRWDGGPLALH